MKPIQKLSLILATIFTVPLITFGFSQVVAADCAGVKTTIVNCDSNGKGKDLKDNGVWQILIIVLNIMAGAVGIAAIGGVVFASILYAGAQDNDAQVKKAKDTIGNVVIGVVAFALMYSFLQFLIPGGVFN